MIAPHVVDNSAHFFFASARVAYGVLPLRHPADVDGQSLTVFWVQAHVEEFAVVTVVVLVQKLAEGVLCFR